MSEMNFFRGMESQSNQWRNNFMKQNQIKCVFICVLMVLFVGFSPNILTSAKKNKEKSSALEWLNQPEVVQRFGEISDAIWSYAELGMQEFKSSNLLADALEQEGFTVERGAAGIPTCFVASYGSGSPVIGILGEYDALPMLSQKGRVPVKDPIVEGAPGHGCGHNTMGTAAAAAAIAVKKVMDEYGIAGTIRVFGSPAEETLISRPYMVRAGLFGDVDVVIDNHNSTILATGYGTSGNAMFSSVFTFKGTTSHGASPWTAKSALDAVEIMNVATNYLREHLYFTYRMHYVVTEGGEAPNVVPDRASVWYFVRNSDSRLEAMHDKVINCAKAGALATGTEMEFRVLSAVHQRNTNKALAEVIQENIEMVGMPKWSEEEIAFAKQIQKELGSSEEGMPTETRDIIDFNRRRFVGGGSSDVGEVTRVVPTATLLFPGRVPGTISHHWSAVASNYGSTAWKGLNAGAKVMAATAIDLYLNQDRLAKIKEEFEAYEKEHPYKPFLPEDSMPPLKLNQELMKKWRPHMEKHYSKHHK
ncbi:MAG: amidohydrolase [Candidatus Aminicenantes bacterium]|nr:amidohydrolase [Candidatus Aminicenantes bacterium]